MSSKSRKRFVIGIAGSSGSGKTTFANRIIDDCRKAGIPSQMFSLDNYYQPLDHLSLRERRSYNFDHPEAIDFNLALEHLRDLCRGRTIPRRPTDLIVVEGLHALYPADLLALYDYKLFVSTGLATAILRRVERDISERGRTVENAHFSINWEGEEIPDKATEGIVRMLRDHFR